MGFSGHLLTLCLRLLLEEDVIRLCKLQSKCFAPASIHHLYPGKRSLTAIKVYSPPRYGTGITGVGFIDNAGVENIWGSKYDAASLVFFLDSAEQVVKIRVYKIDTLVCSLQVSYIDLANYIWSNLVLVYY